MPIIDDVTLFLRFILEFIPLLIKWFGISQSQKKEIIKAMKGTGGTDENE